MEKFRVTEDIESPIEIYDRMSPQQRRAMALAGIRAACDLGSFKSWDEASSAAAEPLKEVIAGIDDPAMQAEFEDLSQAVTDLGARLIALTGAAESGKSTAADYLVRAHGYTRMSFADGLRRGLLEMNPLVPDTGGSTVRLKNLVERIGWNRAKPHAGGEVRRLMQRFGSEAGWMMHGQHLWVDLAMSAAAAAGSPVVFDDARFPHEFQAIHERGGLVIGIERPGHVSALAGAIGTHASETAAQGQRVDARVSNDSTLERLHMQLDAALEDRW